MHVDLGIILFASTSNSLNSLQACSMIIAAGTWTMQETSRPESRHLAIICWWPELRPKPRHESSNWLEFLSPHISSHQFIPDRRPRFSGYLQDLCVGRWTHLHYPADVWTFVLGWLPPVGWRASWVSRGAGSHPRSGDEGYTVRVSKNVHVHTHYIFTYIYRCIYIYILCNYI